MNLYESSYQYEEAFILYKEELEENQTENLDENKSKLNVERIKLFFNWINNTLIKTSSDKETLKKFKKFLLNHFSYLSDLSSKDFSNLIENWFKGEEKEIILSLKNSKSLALQLKYINHYLSTHILNKDTIIEGDIDYEFLLLKINLLIKTGQKEQILNLLNNNTFLCKENLADILLKHKVYDACIFIYYIIDDLDEGIKLANEQIQNILEKIKIEINSEDYNSTKIESLLCNFKKYVNLGISICEKANNHKINYMYLSNIFWIVLINSIYSFQIKFLNIVDENKKNNKLEECIKINKTLDENFQLILSKMSEYIPPKIVFRSLLEKCGSLQLKKIKDLNYLMFSDYRTNERILMINQDIFAIKIEKELYEFIGQYNKGNNIILNDCESCGKSFDNNNVDTIIYFKCKHAFHNLCFQREEYDKHICPICSKKEKETYEEIEYFGIKNDEIICNELFDIDAKREENTINNKDLDNSERKLEIRKSIIKRKNLSKLRKIRKLNQEIKSLLDLDFLNSK